MKLPYWHRGFTIVELLVVVAIIGILTAIVVANLADARASARDKQRIASVEQIALALEVYKQAYGTYPTSANIVGEGASIDDLLRPFLSTVPADPFGPGDSDYQYYYDNDFDCDGTDYAVIYAKTIERSGSANGAATCAGSGIDDAYVVISGPPAS